MSGGSAAAQAIGPQFLEPEEGAHKMRGADRSRRAQDTLTFVARPTGGSKMRGGVNIAQSLFDPTLLKLPSLYCSHRARFRGHRDARSLAEEPQR
jgi:hypothetical protein